MTAKEYLERIGKIDTLVKNKKEEWKFWHDIAYSITASSHGDTPKTQGNPQKMAVAIENYVDIEKAEISDLLKERKEGISTIEKLPYLYYEVIYKRYIEHKDFKVIRSECDKSKSRIAEIHRTALKMIEEFIKENKKQ